MASYPEETHINAWKSQTILNPYTLNCNPYEDESLCDTDPPLDPNLEWEGLGETAVCAVHYEPEYQSRGLGQEPRWLEEETDGDDLVNNTTTENEIEIQSAELESYTCEDTDTQFYRIKTYASREAAEEAGGFVTHVGACGVCSTLQDLAVYANVESIYATSPGNFCQRQAAISFENGLTCYRNLGMTQDCAKLWADTSWNTARNCFGSCVLRSTMPLFSGDSDTNDILDIDTNFTDMFDNIDANFTDMLGDIDTNFTDILGRIDTNFTDSDNAWYNLPATLRDMFSNSENESSDNESKDKTVKALPTNGPAPECAVNNCIKCNDEKSAGIFERFAGRSRRRSGLLSTVARPCSTLPNIIQHPCPETLPLSE